MVRYLVPHWGETWDDAALDYVLRVIDKNNDALYLLTVANNPMSREGMTHDSSTMGSHLSACNVLNDYLISRGMDLLQQVFDKVSDLGVQHRHTVLEFGSPAHVICDTAFTKSIDMIVLGCTCVDALDRALSGATVDYVVRNASCNVLVIKERNAAAHRMGIFIQEQTENHDTTL